MKPGKKLSLRFAASLLCLMAMVLASCGGANSGDSGTKASADKQIFRYPVVGDIATMDPALVQDTDSNFPIQATFTGLVTLDKDLKVQPQLAASMPTVSSDGQTYTFKLRSNLTFSNGDPLTSKDVAYSINRAIDPATKSDVSGYLSLVSGFKDFQGGKVKTLIGTSLLTPDDSTIVIKISQPAAYFLQTLAYPTSYVVNQKLIEKYKGAAWTDHLDDGAGAGPFKVAKYDHSTGLDLVPNDKYYGPKPQLSKLQVLFYKDQNGMYKAYGAKQLDHSPVPTADIKVEKDSKGYSSINVLTIRYLSLNFKAKPFDNMKIRQAFALAIDKQQLVDTAMKGAFTATNHIIPSGMQGYYPDLKGPAGVTDLHGDPTKAKQLLQDGLKEEGLTTLPPITLTYYPRSQEFRDAMDQTTSMWQDVLGVKVNVNTVARATLLSLESSTKGKDSPLQMWQAGWNADYPDPQDWLTTFFDNGSDYNQFNYGQNSSADASAEQAVQKELEQADITQDPVKRMKMYNDAEQKVVEQVGWIPLWQERLQALTSPKIQGFVLNAQQTIAPDDWSKVYVTQ